DQKGYQRQHEEQREKQVVSEGTEKDLEADLRPTTGNDPQRPRVAVVAPHDGRRRFRITDIGDVRRVETRKSVEEILDVFRDVAHLHRIAVDVSREEPQM